MTEPEEAKDRWSALAEELGLPPQPTESPPPLPRAPEAHEAVASEPRGPSELPAAAEERPARGRRRRSVPEAEAATGGPVETPSTEESSEPAETSAGEERPRRRRRTRGNKMARKTPSDAVEEKADAEERPRRRRRRRSKKAEKENEVPSGEMEEDKAEEAPAEESALDEEVDEESEDFSTWNVPSWAEIIAGLYRPEH